MTYARIPERFNDKGLEEFDESRAPEAFIAANEFFNNAEENLREGNGLYLHGENGTGKSHLAFALLGNVTREFGPHGDFMAYPTSKLLQDMKPGEFAESIRQEAEECDLLVLDDFLRCRLTDWGTNQICSLIDYRYNWQKSTIFTANIAPWDIVEKTGDSIWEAVIDRIAETCDVIEMSGESYRIQEATN